MPFSPKGQLQAARAASASCRQWRASQRTVRPPVRCVLHERDTMARTRRTHASTRLGLGLGVALSRALPVFAPSSAGCGTVPPAAPGETAELSLNDAGNNNQRQFYMHVPVGYNASEPTAVVLAFHGWDNDGQDLVYPMTPQSDRSNFIVVGPNGLAENQYTSWNGGGTTQVPYPGPRGPTCDVSYPYTDYCYTSCAARDEGCHPCDWTTCNDDIAFVGTLLDWLEARLCLDLDKVYAVGFSNGATFTYAVSAALSTRIVAFVANSGTPHPGFEVAPERAQSVMDLHGTSDNTCPPDHTSPGPGGSPSGQPSGDGWYYLDVASTLTLWLDVLQAARTSAAGCGSLEPPVDPAASPPSYLTSADGERGLSCVRLDPGASCIGDDALNSTKIVRCSFEGGHEVHPSMPRVAWEFLSGEVDETCVDDDACLQHRPGWDDSYHCETSVSFCTGEYTSDLSACCPEACGLCPVPRPPPPPHAPDSPGGGSSATPAEFPIAKVLGGLGAYVGIFVIAMVFCACCTTAAVKRESIRASLRQRRRGGGRKGGGGSLPVNITRGRSSSQEQPMMPRGGSAR